MRYKTDQWLKIISFYLPNRAEQNDGIDVGSVDKKTS